MYQIIAAMAALIVLSFIVLIAVLSVPLGADSLDLARSERGRDKLWSR